ncbi:MAG: FHA domain-containing protein [Desulfovibrio sp.]|nr:FHA domain-containing protein [Desulfovibrio sp.]
MTGKPVVGGKVHALLTVTVGRSKECDVIFSDQSVSRKHCSVEMLSDGTFFLRDLQSKNGTFVDNVQIKQKHITTSSRIRLGNVNIAGADIISRIEIKCPVVTTKRASDNTLFYIMGVIAAAALLIFFVHSSKNVLTVPNHPSVSVSPQQSSSVDWMRDVEKSTVIIVGILPDGKYTCGSGFFVNGRTVITNRHVIRNAHVINLGNRIIGSYTARIIAISQELSMDFAALDVGKDVAVPLPLTTSIKRNDKVYAWGYPGILVGMIQWNGLPEVVSTSGEINVIRNGVTSILVHSAKISPGSSGGPLVNVKGYVIGINTFMLGDENGRYYVSYTSKDIINFLKTNEIKYNVQ